MIWYLVPRWDDVITPVAVRKETDKYLYLAAGRRTLKRGNDNYFPTYEAAREYLVWECTSTRDACQVRLDEAEARLETVMVIPQEEPTP